MIVKRINIYSLCLKLLMGICLTMMVSWGAYAQKASDDFKKIGEAFKEARLSFDVHYQMYADHQSDKQIQSKKAVYYIWDRMSCYKMDEVEVVNNDRFNLSIDHKGKRMVLNKTHAGQEKKYMKQILKVNLDSLLARNSEVTLVSQSEKERIWKINYKRALKGIASVEVKLELPSYRLSKIVIYYSKSFRDIYGTSPEGVSKTQTPRLEIVYSNYQQLSGDDKEKYFSAAQILSIDKKGKVIVTDPYKKYLLANYYQLK